MNKNKTSRNAISRRSRDVFLFIAMAAIIAVIAIDKTALRPFRKSIVESKQRGPDGEKYHLKTFTVVYIVDGDTFDLDIEDGNNKTTRVRPLGIDTPETKHPKYPAMYYGPEATEYTTKLLLNKKVTVIIDTVSQSRDPYGRLLCFIDLPDGRDFGQEMITMGYAYADLRFENGRFDEYAKLQEQAVAKGVGLWKEVNKDQLPPWMKRERPDILGLRLPFKDN